MGKEGKYEGKQKKKKIKKNASVRLGANSNGMLQRKNNEIIPRNVIDSMQPSFFFLKPSPISHHLQLFSHNQIWAVVILTRFPR